MKNLLIVGLLLCHLSTYAQLQKGNWQFGGSLSISTSNETINGTSSYERKQQSFSLIPRAGVFISDNAVLGMAINYTSSDTKNDDNDSNTNLLYVGPYMRWHKPVSEAFALFVQTDARVGFGNSEIDGSKSKAFAIEAGIAPGLVYFPSSKWGIEATFGSLRYSYTKSEDDDYGYDYDNSSFDFGVNLSALTMGVQYYLAR